MRVADSVAREPWSNDMLASAIRLMGYLHTRWARDGLSSEEGCQVVLSAGQLMDLTGSGSLMRARRTLRALAVHVTLTVVENGAYTLVEWRKFADFQGWESESGADRGKSSGSKMPPPHPASRIPHPEEEKTQSRSAPPPAGAAAPERVRPAPRRRPPAPPPPWAVDAAGELARATRRRWPGALVPAALAGWARKLAGIRAAESDVVALLRWYCDLERDGPGGGIAPYTPEVRSGAAFAAKWNQLIAARAREQRRIGGDDADLIARTREILRRDEERFGERC